MSSDVTGMETRTVSRTVRLVRAISSIGMLAYAAAWIVMTVLEVQQDGRPVLSGSHRILFHAAWCPIIWGVYWSEKRAGGQRLRFLFVLAVLYSIIIILGVTIILFYSQVRKGSL